MLITYNEGHWRHERSIGVTKFDDFHVLLTGMPKRGNGTCNGIVYYQTVVIHRNEMVDTHEAKVEIWDKCGVVGHREDNVQVVPAICELFGCPNPGVYVSSR